MSQTTINYYEALKISPQAEFDQIKEILLAKHSEALRKLNNTVGDAEREYRVRKEIELIEEALEIFTTEESKAKYDRRLSEEEELKDKKAGPLISISQSFNSSKTPMRTKADNYLIRARQFLDQENFKDAKEFIEAALNEDATSFSAWELMFNCEFIRGHATSKYSTESGTYRFPAFTVLKELENIDSDEVKKGMLMFEKIIHLRTYFARANYKVEELADMKEEIDLVKKWLEEKGPVKLIASIASFYRETASAKDFNYFYSNAYMYDNASNAYDHALKYADRHQKSEMNKRVLDLLKDCYFHCLKVNQEHYQDKAERHCKRLLDEICDYQQRTVNALAAVSKGKETKNIVLSIVLIGVSLFIIALFLGKYGLALGKTVNSFVAEILLFNNELTLAFRRFFLKYELLTLIIMFLVLMPSMLIIASTKVKILGYIQWLIVFIPIVYYGLYALKYWNYHGFFTFLFRLGLSVVLGFFWFTVLFLIDTKSIKNWTTDKSYTLPFRNNQFYGV